MRYLVRVLQVLRTDGHENATQTGSRPSDRSGLLTFGEDLEQAPCSGCYSKGVSYKVRTYSTPLGWKLKMGVPGSTPAAFKPALRQATPSQRFM